MAGVEHQKKLEQTAVNRQTEDTRICRCSSRRGKKADLPGRHHVWCVADRLQEAIRPFPSGIQVKRSMT
jgi:hypothetical protein